MEFLAAPCDRETRYRWKHPEETGRYSRNIYTPGQRISHIVLKSVGLEIVARIFLVAKEKKKKERKKERTQEARAVDARLNDVETF